MKRKGMFLDLISARRVFVQSPGCSPSFPSFPSVPIPSSDRFEHREGRVLNRREQRERRERRGNADLTCHPTKRSERHRFTGFHQFTSGVILGSRRANRETYTGEKVEPILSRSEATMPPDSTPPIDAKSRRRLWLLYGLLFLTTAGGVVGWWMTQLNELERQFLGQWTTMEEYDDGSTVTRTWELRRDRTVHIHNQYHWIAALGRPAWIEEAHAEMTLSIRGGRLLFNPIHPTPKRLNVLWKLTCGRVRNAFNGTPGIVMDVEGSNGRLSAVEADSFTVTWWDPEKQVEHSTVIYTRVRPDPTVHQ